MRHLALCGVVALGSFGFGCAGAPVAKEEARAPFAPQVDVSAPLRANARWVPASADMVFVADVDATMAWVVGAGAEDPNAGRAAKLEARERALREDVQALALERFGVDFTTTHTVIAATRSDQDDAFVVVLLGATHGQSEQAGVFEVLPRHPVDRRELGAVATVWGVAIPDGVALYASRELAEAIVEDEAASLASSELGGRALDMLAGKQGRMAFALMPAEGSALAQEFAQGDIPLTPELVAVSVGDETHVAIEGDPGQLAAFDAQREAFFTERAEAARARLGDREDVHLFWSFALVVHHHAVEGAREALTTSLSGSRLTYSVPSIPAYMLMTSAVTTHDMLENFEWERDWELGQQRSEQAFTMNERISVAIKAELEKEDPCADLSALFDAPPSSPVPRGGEAVVPNFEGPLWASLGMAEEKTPQLFSYSITGEVDEFDGVGSYHVDATADFDPTSPEVHTVRTTLYVFPDDEKCSVIIQPGLVQNALE
jgi:hypothetical protein